MSDLWQCRVGLHKYVLATRNLRSSRWRCERCQKVKWKKPDAGEGTAAA